MAVSAIPRRSGLAPASVPTFATGRLATRADLRVRIAFAVDINAMTWCSAIVAAEWYDGCLSDLNKNLKNRAGALFSVGALTGMRVAERRRLRSTVAPRL